MCCSPARPVAAAAVAHRTSVPVRRTGGPFGCSSINSRLIVAAERRRRRRRRARRPARDRRRKRRGGGARGRGNGAHSAQETSAAAAASRRPRPTGGAAGGISFENPRDRRTVRQGRRRRGLDHRWRRRRGWRPVRRRRWRRRERDRRLEHAEVLRWWWRWWRRRHIGRPRGGRRRVRVRAPAERPPGAGRRSRSVGRSPHRQSSTDSDRRRDRFNGGASAGARSTPNGYQITDCHFVISPAPAAGATSPAPSRSAPASAALPVTAGAVGLAPGTSYTATLVAASVPGVATGQPVASRRPRRDGAGYPRGRGASERPEAQPRALSHPEAIERGPPSTRRWARPSPSSCRRRPQSGSHSSGCSRAAPLGAAAFPRRARRAADAVVRATSASPVRFRGPPTPAPTESASKALLDSGRRRLAPGASGSRWSRWARRLASLRPSGLGSVIGS